MSACCLTWGKWGMTLIGAYIFALTLGYSMPPEIVHSLIKVNVAVTVQ